MGKIKVYFSKNASTLVHLQLTGILVRPADDNWNDFGIYSQFDYAVIQNGRYDWRRFRMGFLGTNDSPFDVLIKGFYNKTAEVFPADDFPEFFSLQPDVESYRDLIETYGLDFAKEILSALGDLVQTSFEPEKREKRESAMKSDIFVFSLIRSEGGYNAFHHGYEALLGIAREKISLAPVKLELPLSGSSGFSLSVPVVFEFSQEGLFPQRISVLIGKNGVGKSRMLNHICECYLDQFCYNFLPKVSRLIAIRTPGETEYTFPLKPESSQVDYLKLSTSFEDDSPIEDSLPETLYRLSRSHWSSDELERPRWTLFKRAISKVLPVSALVIAAAELGTESPTSRTVALEDLTAYSEHVRLEARRALEASGVIFMMQDDRLVPLSSGQLSFLRLAAQLAYNVVRGSLVLIDEPETHLHPQLISQFMAMLDSILSVTESVAIVATHSPYVVREVPAEQVKIVYRESSGAINVTKPRLKTLGADVGSISASIFADELVIENVKKIANEIRVNPEKYADWETMLKAELSSEAVLHIRQFLRGESMFTK